MHRNFSKENIKRYYNEEAEIRDGKHERAEWKTKVREKFYSLIELENKKTLLEIGAGPGYDSLFFMNKGLLVTAVDISREMADRCREKGIEAYELDFYNLSSLNKKFDCIYALNTLLHVPRTDLPKVLKEIDLSLNNNGALYIGLYGGENIETEFVKRDISDAPRFFSFYSDKYLKEVLKDYFTIVSFETLDLGTDIFHSITLKKK